LASDKNTRNATRCNFLLLTLTTVAAVFLAFGEPLPLVAAVITAAVTALGGIVRFQDYGLKALMHADSTMQWADVEGELLTILHACSEEEQQQRFKDAAKDFDEANIRQPLLPPLRGFNNKGKPLFEFITESAVHKEKLGNLKAMRKLVSHKPPTDDDEDELPSAATNTSFSTNTSAQSVEV